MWFCNFGEKMWILVLILAGKYDFAVWQKIRFYSFSENFDYAILAEKEDFAVFARKYDSINFLGEIEYTVLVAKCSSAILAENVILQFGEKYDFMFLLGKWFCDFERKCDFAKKNLVFAGRSSRTHSQNLQDYYPIYGKRYEMEIKETPFSSNIKYNK